MQAHWTSGIDSLVAQIQPSTELVAQELKKADLVGKTCLSCHYGKLLPTNVVCMQCHHKETKADCLQCHEDAKVQIVVYQGKRLDHKSHVDKSRFIGGAGENIQCSTCHASDIKQSFKGECAPCHHDEKQIADKISLVSSVVYCESCHPIQTAMYKGSQYNLPPFIKGGLGGLPCMKFDAKVDCVKCHKLDAIKMTKARCDTAGCHKEQPPAPSPLIKGGRGVVGKGEGDYAAIMDTWQTKTRISIAQAEILEQKVEKLLTDWDVPEAKQLYSNAKESLDFVRKDGSLGVHHPELVDKLMKSSIEWLQQSLQLLTRKIQG